MSETPKHSADPDASVAIKKAKALDGTAVFKQEVPAAVSFEAKDGHAFKQDIDDEGSKAKMVFKEETDDESESPNKPSVLTFTAAHDRFPRIQLLSSHTLYVLVAALCRYTPVGYEGQDGPDDHLWYITFNGKKYESSDVECVSPHRANTTRLCDLHLSEGCQLYLTYDYGTTSHYMITLEGQRDMEEGEERAMFPRNDSSHSMPAAYKKYEPTNIGGNDPPNLDAMFPVLNKWMFTGDNSGESQEDNGASNVRIDLFQAGKKKNYGYMDNGLTMMFLPTKPDHLANYLKWFNDGARRKPKQSESFGCSYLCYEWHSVCILPHSKLTDALLRKYHDNEEVGFCDAPIPANMFRIVGKNDLDAFFPKVAALAGFRRDYKVPKGWVTFTKRGDQCNLAICTGNTLTLKPSNAPKGTAFDGQAQHEPEDPPLFEVSGVNIQGLHDLFCVVEGLLRTL